MNYDRLAQGMIATGLVPALPVAPGTDISPVLFRWLSSASGPQAMSLRAGDYKVGKAGLITQLVSKRLVLNPDARLIQTDSTGPAIDLWVPPSWVENVLAIEDVTITNLDNPVGDAAEGLSHPVTRVRISHETGRGLKRGDRVKLFSNDVILPGNHRWALPDDVLGVTSPLTKKLKHHGEFAFVSGVTNNGDGTWWIALSSETRYVRPGAINPRLSLLPDITFEMFGGRFTYADDINVNLAVASNQGWLRTKGHYQPRVEGCVVERSWGTFWGSWGTFQGHFAPAALEDGYTSPANNQFGYGIDARSTWQQTVDLRAVNTYRHGHTDNAAEAFVNGHNTDPSPGAAPDPSNYGVAFGTVEWHGVSTAMKNGVADGHNESVGCRYYHGTVFGTYPGARSGGPAFDMRGGDVTASGGVALNCYKGLAISTFRNGKFSDYSITRCTNVPLSFISGDFTVGAEGNLEATVSDSVFGALDPSSYLMEVKTGLYTQVCVAWMSPTGLMTVTQLLSGNGTGLKAGSIVQFPTGSPIKITSDNQSGANGATGTYQTDYTGPGWNDQNLRRAVAGPNTRARITLSNVTLMAEGNIAFGSNLNSPIFVGAWAGGVELNLDNVVLDLRNLKGWGAANAIDGVVAMTILADNVKVRGKLTVLAGENLISRIVNRSDASFQNLADVDLQVVYEGRRDITGTQTFDHFARQYHTGTLLGLPNAYLRGTKTFGIPTITCNYTANAATDVLTITADAYAAVITGDTCRVSTTSAAPGGLSTATTYFVIKTGTASQIKLATSRSNALAGTAVDVTDAGTGTQTIDLGAITYTDSKYWTQSIAAAGVIGISGRGDDRFEIRLSPSAELSGANAATLSDPSGLKRGQEIVLYNTSTQFSIQISSFPGAWIPPRGSLTLQASDANPPVLVPAQRSGNGGAYTLAGSVTLNSASLGLQTDGCVFQTTGGSTTNITLGNAIHAGWRTRAIQLGTGVLTLILQAGATWVDGTTGNKTAAARYGGFEIECISNSNGALAVYRATPI